MPYIIKVVDEGLKGGVLNQKKISIAKNIRNITKEEEFGEKKLFQKPVLGSTYSYKIR